MLIFLDIDGVMVPAKSWIRQEVLEDGFAQFSAPSVNVLKQLITDEVSIILTSSHRFRFTQKQWKDIFLNRGVSVGSIMPLGVNGSRLNRKEEILSWLILNNPSEKFLIIDDDKSLNDLPPHIKERLILTQSMIGLNSSHLPEIQKKLSIQDLAFSQISNT